MLGKRLTVEIYELSFRHLEITINLLLLRILIFILYNEIKI